tara:strand:+ start:10785 stop:11966 length:1182 start_codon:yes stop_codon:yes gene_type:complete
MLAFVAHAEKRDQAKQLYSSLTGGTANKAIADKYEAMIANGKVELAAKEIIESNEGFYNVTLKNFFTPMTNEDGSQFTSLNDMSALLIGATRDEIDFFRVFWDNIMYQFDGTLTGRNRDRYYLEDLDVTVPKYNRTKNDMYVAAEEGLVPLGNRKYFIQTQQNTYTTLDGAAIAGMFSTRGFAAAYYPAGTNRAAFAYFAKNFLCKEMEELSDTSVPDFRVRRDVDRAPGGSADTYKTYCVGCHAGQDALGGAFAYYDYVDGRMVYAAHDVVVDGNAEIVGPVAPKINNINTFADGKITTSDSWINLWTDGQNESIGWGPQNAGNGAKDLGKMLAETKQVRTCLSQQVFETVCHRSPTSELDKNIVNSIAQQFDRDRNMKNVFINAAIACMGE